MRIACLGWGSLIWDSRELNKPKDQWGKDGPFLPIEFNRKSKDGRITLIIDREAAPLNVLWVELDQTDLNSSIALLAEREGSNLIDSVGVNDSTDDPVKSEIITWITQKKFDAAIWTGLSYKNGIRLGLNEVVEYLAELSGATKKLAEEYIRRTPPQISTAYRKAIEETLGWTPVD
jgi:hypothetical protein